MKFINEVVLTIRGLFDRKYRDWLNVETTARIFERTGITRHRNRVIILAIACKVHDLSLQKVWMAEERLVRTINLIKLSF
jgi:hypothetical protein